MAGNSRARSSRKSRHASKPLPDPPSPDQLLPPIPLSDPGFDDAEWGYFTEEQLEELLLKNLDFVYKEALGRLVSLGYDEDVALRAILSSGHCYGSMDILSNILHNALAHLNAPLPASSGPQDSPEGPGPAEGLPRSGFSDLRHLQEYSLAGMICLLQQVRPNLCRGDAMWCLLMSDLHVGRASSIQVPAPQPPSAGSSAGPVAVTAPAAAAVSASVGAEQVVRGSGADYSAASLCKYHSATSGAVLAGSIDPTDPWFANLPPSVKSALRRRSFMVPKTNDFLPFVKSLAARAGVAWSLEEPNSNEESVASGNDKNDNNDKEGSGLPNNDVVDSVLKALEGMSLKDEEAEDPKKDMIMDVIRQIRELEVQVKERKEWAQQKALQAARKLSNDMTELRMLRMEREENQRLKKGKQALEDTTMKRLSEMENALKKASVQVDRANDAVRKLEMENAEIRAEMEASKLSASESAKTYAEVTRREKKSLKKLAALEKQKDKMQEEIAEEKKKIFEMQQRIVQVRSATKENEVKWKQEMLAKEQAIALAEEERRAKEVAKVNANRRLEAQRQKIELDVQWHKDDIQRLEEEFARLKASALARQAKGSSVNALISEDDIIRALQDVTGTAHNGSNKPKEVLQKLNYNRKCVICKKEEISVVFLPCAHQVVCTNCNEDHDKKGKTGCPCCNVKIVERIRVYGASS